jgi:hypothetical protein
MAFIYGAPFILLSIFAFLVCALLPRLRAYKFQALVVPVAFGFCSIVAWGTAVLVGDRIGEKLHISVFSEPVMGLKGWLIFLTIYLVPGIIGACVAAEVARRITAP